jgi:hypothetical protein
MKHIFIITIFLALGTTAAWGQDWRMQHLSHHESGYDYRVSSELEDPGPRQFGRYGGHNLFDRNPATCWAEGVPGTGRGEYVFVSIPKGDRTIHILNGYHKSQALFMKNNRIKDLALSMYVAVFRPDQTTELFEGYDIARYGKVKRVTLPDSMKPQTIRFPWDWNEIERFMDQTYAANPKTRDLTHVPEDLRRKYLVRVEIVDVYPGTKYNDTCISEIRASR